MKKIQKSKRGFTLIEMIIVIAIIVILASVLFFSVTAYLDRAKGAAEKIETHNAAITQIAEEVDDYLAA
jgi:type IV pilus assembly protein PilA